MSLNADASKILECREALLPIIEAKHRVRITVTDIIMKITGEAIKEHPVVNTRWTAEGVLFLKMSTWAWPWRSKKALSFR